MTKLFIFIGGTAGSYLGWWLGSFSGVMGSLFLSTVLGCAGIYAGWKVGDTYFG